MKQFTLKNTTFNALIKFTTYWIPLQKNLSEAVNAC